MPTFINLMANDDSTFGLKKKSTTNRKKKKQKQDRILSTAINAICRAITLMASTCQICPSKLVPRNGGALTTRTFWPIGLCMDLSARVDFWGQVMWVSILSNVGH